MSDSHPRCSGCQRWMYLHADAQAWKCLGCDQQVDAITRSRRDWSEALDLIDWLGILLSTHSAVYHVDDAVKEAHDFVARFRGTAAAGPRPGMWPSGEVAEP